MVGLFMGKPNKEPNQKLPLRSWRVEKPSEKDPPFRGFVLEENEKGSPRKRRERLRSGRKKSRAGDVSGYARKEGRGSPMLWASRRRP